MKTLNDPLNSSQTEATWRSKNRRRLLTPAPKCSSSLVFFLSDSLTFASWVSKLPKSASHNTPDRKFECAVWIGIPPCLVVGRFSPAEELEEGSNTHARARRRTKKVIEYSSQKVFSFSLAHQPPIFLLVTHQPSSPVRGTLAAAGAANVWQDKQVSRSFEKKTKKKI